MFKPAPHPVQRSARSRAAGILVLTAGTGLIVASASGFIESSTRVPANRYFATHDHQFTSVDASAASVETAIAHYLKIPPSMRGAEEWRRLGGLLLITHKADSKYGVNRPRASHPDVAAALDASLKKEPAHPLTWAYLADSALRSQEDKQQALAYLKQSYRVGPLDPDFFFYRLVLAFRCKSEWDATIIKGLKADIESLFPAEGSPPNRKRFIQLSQTSADLRTVTTALLKSSPAALRQYLDAIGHGR